MLTLQRSPRIVCADVLDQVNFEKDPTLSYLRSRYFAASCFFLQRDRVNLQIVCGLLQGECAHGYVPATVMPSSPVLPRHFAAVQP